MGRQRQGATRRGQSRPNFGKSASLGGATTELPRGLGAHLYRLFPWNGHDFGCLGKKKGVEWVNYVTGAEVQLYYRYGFGTHE